MLAHRLRTDPSLIPAFVEEVLRLESPAQGMFRQAKRDVVVGGVEIPAGHHIFLAYASANIDAEAFACPAELQLERKDGTNHLAFGRGTHYCLGAPLARQEARIALTMLLSTMTNISVHDEAEVCYGRSYFLHGLQRLDLTFDPV